MSSELVFYLNESLNKVCHTYWQNSIRSLAPMNLAASGRTHTVPRSLMRVKLLHGCTTQENKPYKKAIKEYWISEFN